MTTPREQTKTEPQQRPPRRTVAKPRAITAPIRPSRPARLPTQEDLPCPPRHQNGQDPGSVEAGPAGVTLKELMKATGWQAHSVRGFLSGTIGKKMGITVESFQSAASERSYRISSK